MQVQVDCETFGKWQPIYEDHGIYTFPVRDKRPLARAYSKIGERGSRALAERNPGAEAFGFALGKRSGITILDVDSPDERLLADALTRHGPTPFIVRSGSGNHQAWYRHGGERRSIRPNRELPIDVLGAGFVVAPPSKGKRGHYKIIKGNLDDLDRLPVMASPPAAPEPLRPAAPTSSLDRGQRVPKGQRNKSLWEHCMRSAKACDDLDALLDVGRTFNDNCDPPLEDAEVIKTVRSVWNLESEGKNRFGRHGAYFSKAAVMDLMQSKADQDSLLLLLYLKVNQGSDREFMVANGLANLFDWRRQRFADARKNLEIRGDIIVTQRARGEDPTGACRWRAGPARYRWP